MTQTFGKLKAFEPEVENISTYLERVQLHFEANEVADDKKVSVLLTVIGSRNYGLIRSLVAPALPKDKTLEQLIAFLKGHFQPKPLVVAECYRFHQRTQGSTESVQGFIADLRRLAITCDFGAFLDRALRDQFVFGLHSEQIRKTLLAEDGITLTRAVEIAQAKESAFRDAKALQGATNATATVLQMSSSVQANHTGRPKLCFRCGRSGHDRQIPTC